VIGATLLCGVASLVGCGFQFGGLSPSQPDADADGLSDARERALGTNPNDPDSDDDSLLDGDEMESGTSPLAADSDGDGLDDGTDPLPSQSSTNVASVSTGNDVEPNDDFARAVVLANAGSEALTFQGRIDLAGDVDLFDLGPLRAGDRIEVDLRGRDTTASLLLSVFDNDQSLFAATQRTYAGGADIVGLIDEIVRHDSDHYFFGITHEAAEPKFGTYRIDVTLRREMEAPPPIPQVVFLDFDGGTLSTALLGVSIVPPFNASLISPIYEGRSVAMKDVIIERFIANFAGFDVITVTSDEASAPAVAEYTTLLFGSFHESVLGVSIALDRFNADRCDDGIIFTEAFKPFVFGFPPSWDSVGVAIGNVAAHEAGHLLGLYHVTDPTALMDERSAAVHLLSDQQFKTASLSDSVFPLGSQNSELLLAETVGEVQ